MKKIILLLPLLPILVVAACILYIWASFSPTVDDYKTIHNRDSEIGLVFAFATALRINHPDVYDMIDPSLKPRLDEWMNTHQSQKCTRLPDLFLGGPDIDGYYGVTFSCHGTNRRIDFEIDNIDIRNMKVIDWGEIREED